jgi:hypothetical protein
MELNAGPVTDDELMRRARRDSPNAPSFRRAATGKADPAQ